MHRSRWMVAVGCLVMAAVTSVRAGGFLGVATEPVNPLVAEHLELPAGVGLQVMHVVEDGPSAGILNENDILHKLDGQILINHDQLATLVRHLHEAGETVKCELLRRGKKETVEIKLGEAPEALPHQLRGFSWNDEEPTWHQGARGMRRRLQRLPEDLESAQRQIEELLKDLHQNPVFTHPWNPGGQGLDGDEPSVTIRKSARSEVQVTENGLTIKLIQENGDKHLTVTQDGRKVFDGPINTDEQREKIPEEIREKVREVESQVKVDVRVRPSVGGEVNLQLEPGEGI